MSSPTAPLKIFTICLVSHKKHKAAAIFNGETLVITQVVPITGLFNSWRKSLIEEIEQKLSEGFIVIVEEKTDYVSRHATQYLLEDMNDDNDGMRRSNYYDALDWYFALSDTDNLIIHPDFQQFRIAAGQEGGKIERKQDDKGRTVYSVNWQQFHGGYRAVLLCVVAALYEPLSDRYLAEMFQMDDDKWEIKDPAQRFKRLIHEVSLQQGKELEKLKEAIE